MEFQTKFLYGVMDLLFSNYLARSRNFAKELNLKLRIEEIY